MLCCEQHSHVAVSSSSQKRRVLHDGEISRENWIAAGPYGEGNGTPLKKNRENNRACKINMGK